MQLANSALWSQRPNQLRVTDLDVFLLGGRGMTVGELWHRSIQRAALRRAALRYADRGWRVVPGAALIDDRYVCGPLCPTVGCHPAVDHWERVASNDSEDIDRWWSEGPFSVLLATGHMFDVIEVPAHLGAAAARSTTLGPVAVSPAGRWMFLVEPGDSLRPELAARLDIVQHGPGSWVPAPPTRTPSGHIRWEIHPHVTGWEMPNPYAVQKVLVAHLRPAEPTFTTRRVA
jgi:hypothetical protein